MAVVLANNCKDFETGKSVSPAGSVPSRQKEIVASLARYEDANPKAPF
jgi:hypothetical protein